MTALTTRRATPEDAQFVATNLRDQDVQELKAMGVRPQDGVLVSYQKADWCEVLVEGEWPIAIFGVCPSATPGVGLPWLLGTCSMAAVGRTFLRGCKPTLDRMLASYPALVNITHECNTVSRRWLSWLGFTFYAPARTWMAQRGFDVPQRCAALREIGRRMRQRGLKASLVQKERT